MMRPIALSLIVLLAACNRTDGPDGTTGSAGTNASETPPVAAWDSQPQGAAWTAMLESTLNANGAALLAANPSDIGEFCPDFPALDVDGRRDFYVGLISRMAEFESDFDPTTSFTESFNDAQGQRVVSRGLLQLSFESANAYPGCSLDDPQQLHDPATNLTCTVAILDRLVGRDQVIGRRVDDSWRGGAAYWSVLRQTSDRRARIASFTSGLEICQPG